MKKQTESDLVAEAVAYMRLHFARPLKLTKVAKARGLLSRLLEQEISGRTLLHVYLLSEPDPGRTEQAASPQPLPSR